MMSKEHEEEKRTKRNERSIQYSGRKNYRRGERRGE
jgi:hypothetical protein